MFIGALFTIGKTWKQPKRPSTEEWIKKLSNICNIIWNVIIMEYYAVIKNKEILLLVTTWMDLEGIMLSKISQTEKDKYCMISLICGI